MQTGTVPPTPRVVAYLQPTSEVGGSDIALYRLVSHLDRARYRPVVILPRDGALVGKLQEAAVLVDLLRFMQLRSVKSLGYQTRYLARFTPSVLHVASALRRHRASLVHSNSLYCLYGAWAARLAGIPHVWHVREIPTLPWPLRSGLARLALLLSDRVVAMTNAVASMFPSAGRQAQKLKIIPDGIDLRQYHPSVSGQRIRSDLQIPADASFVGFVARLDPWKGADVFVRAAAHISDKCPATHFLVCAGTLPGYEQYARGLRDLAAGLGLNGKIHFTDWRYRLDDIPEVMASLDVFVHTSVQPEPFGLVLVEAMATGKPVVAADCGGVPEVVTSQVTGLLAPPGDWQAVAEAIMSLLKDPRRARAMGAAGRQRAEQLFEVSAYARSVQALYDEILSTGWRARW